MLLTIYTPTYNRKALLTRLYESLLRQSCKDFIWLIIDDGSTDDTGMLVEMWNIQSPFQIEYVYKKNGGVHTARDAAYRMVSTELIWGVDSDDWLFDDSIERVLKFWKEYGDESFCGIFAAVCDIKGESKRISYPKLNCVTYEDLFYKYGARGDQVIIAKTQEMKKLKPYPEYENEKLVSESFKWIQLTGKPFLILDEPVTYIEYQNDGYTNNVRKNFFKNLNGYCDLYDMCMLCCSFKKKRIEFAIKYLIASFFLKRSKRISNSSRPILVMSVYFCGLVAYQILKRKWKMYR